MKISVFGLGYVGVVTAACLAKEGHEIIGIDISESKVDLVNSGKTPIIEEGIAELVAEQVANGSMRASLSAAEGVTNSDMAIICVGTPSRPSGALNQEYLIRVTEEIASQIKDRTSDFLFVFRSTMVPGTLETKLLPLIEEKTNRKLGDGYDVLFHPEFLREGTSIHDFYNPPKIVVGGVTPDSADKLLSIYDEKFEAPRITCSISTAETVKYCDNLFHAVKVTFANEVGEFCYEHGINAAEAMSIFVQDTKLNISPKYLRPGFAFGGSCLPKDTRAFLAEAHSKGLRLPMIEGVLSSNTEQIERALRIILKQGIRNIGMYGLSFKPGTDDLRESPLVELAERLIGKGMNLKIYDSNVKYAQLIGGNKSFIEERLPHIAKLLSNNISDLNQNELIILGHEMDPASVSEQFISKGIITLDLTGTLRADNKSILSII